MRVRTWSSEHRVKVVNIGFLNCWSLVGCFECSERLVAERLICEFFKLRVNWFVVSSKWFFYHAVFEGFFFCVVWVCHFKVHVSRFEDGWAFQCLPSCQIVLGSSCPFQVLIWRGIFDRFRFLVLFEDSEVFLIDMFLKRFSWDNSLFGFVGLRSNETAFGTFREDLCVIMAGSDGILGRGFFPPLSLE